MHWFTYSFHSFLKPLLLIFHVIFYVINPCKLNPLLVYPISLDIFVSFLSIFLCLILLMTFVSLHPNLYHLLHLHLLTCLLLLLLSNMNFSQIFLFPWRCHLLKFRLFRTLLCFLVFILLICFVNLPCLHYPRVVNFLMILNFQKTLFGLLR